MTDGFPRNPYVETSMRKATNQKKQSRITLRIIITEQIVNCHLYLSWVTVTGHSTRVHSSQLDMSVHNTLMTPGTPTGAQHGASKREEKESEETKPTETRKEKRPDRPPKRQKRATERRREQARTGPTAGTTRGRTHHRGRNPPTHPTPQASAHQTKKQRKESREERTGYKLTPGERTTEETTEGPMKCIPTYSEHTNHTGTI